MSTLFEITVKTTKPKSIRMFSEGRVGARLIRFANGIEAVMKVGTSAAMKDQRTLQAGIATATMPRREVAFYRLSKMLGFDIVPETVLGEFEGFPASFQQYVTCAKLYELDPRLRRMRQDKEAWVIALRETLRDKVQSDDTLQLTVVDFLAGARDRHGANYGARLELVSNQTRWRLIGWDNGCTFGLTMARYHCIAHKYLFRHAFDLTMVWKRLRSLSRSQLVTTLKDLISEEEIDHVWLRSQFILAFPHRMPFAILSKGSDDPDAFPGYDEYFKPMTSDRPLFLPTRSVNASA
jgi:hypothetical protein